MGVDEVSDHESVDITKTNTKLLGKRTSYLDWNEYFMAVAFLSAQRSKDPRTQVGACIVNEEKKIVGIGYNGMPLGCNDDLMPWNRAQNGSKEQWLQSKTPYVCHAELNAVLNKNLADIKGCVIYVALFPCNMCAQIIIQSRISEVIYYSDKYHDRPEFVASRRMFEMAKIKYRQFRPRQKTITIDFDLIEITPGDAPHTADKHQGNNVRADVDDNSNDENKISSDAKDSCELLKSPENDVPQPGGLNPVPLEDLQQRRLKLIKPNMFNNLFEVFFAIISAIFVVFLAVVLSNSSKH